MDGSPKPRLAWYLGDGSAELDSSVFLANTLPKAIIAINVTREDNDREYRYPLLRLLPYAHVCAR